MQGRNPVAQVAVCAFELGGRNVHADLEIGLKALPPVGHLARGFVEHPVPHADNEARVLGQWNELGRPHQTVFGALPANQRLGLANFARGHVHNGLVDQVKFVAFQSGAQV